MTLPPQFRSGDIIRMETTSGPLVARLVDDDDPNFLEIRWDWPWCPLDVEEWEEYLD